MNAIRRCFQALAVLFLAAFLVDGGGVAHAGTCSVTDFPPTGTITSTNLNARFNQMENCNNGNIGNVNWNANEPLALSNLQNQNALMATSFTIADEDGDAIAGEDIASTNNIRKWRLQTTMTVVGMSVGLRCPSDVTGTPGDCAAASVTVVLQKDASTIKTFAAIATDVVQLDNAISNSATSAQIMNIDISGTFTDVDFIDVVVYYKAPHQS